MDGMAIFYLVWMIVLPILAIILLVLIPVVWFFIIPKLARKLTWARFGKSNIAAISDSAGWVDIIVSREDLPEGVTYSKDGSWRFLPRSKWKQKPSNEEEKDKAEEAKLQEKLRAQNIILQKFTLRGLGKPIWFGYAGKVPLVNPSTLAVMQQSEESKTNPTRQIVTLKRYIETLPKHFARDLRKLVKDLELHIKAVPVTLLDPRVIKEVLPQMYTPSQLDAVATNRYNAGLDDAGKDYGKLAMGMGLVMGLVVIAIIAIMVLK